HITEDLRYLADRSEEWRQRGKALAGLESSLPEQKAEAILIEAAVACLEEGLPRAALEFQEESLISGRRRADPITMANALQWRALAHCRLDKHSDALEDLEQGRSWAAKIEDISMRQRMDSELDYAGGLASSLGDPERARLELTEALDYFRSKRN